MSRFKLSRADYKTIKGYNREEMEQYMTNMYVEGFNDGVHTISSRLAIAIDEGIKKTKGVGDKIHDLLIKNILAELANKSDINDNNS